jgi:2'-5' RNA ligase
MIRAFVAVELGDTLRSRVALVQDALRRALAEMAPVARVAWVAPASIHLTLKFLGNIDESRVDEFRDAVTIATRACRPVAIPIARLGAFPRVQQPGNLWLGPPEEWSGGDDAERLRQLVRAIDDCAEMLGVARENRPFAPHLTLGRVKTGERHVGRALPNVRLPLDAGDLQLVVSHVALMKSAINSAGAVHTPVWNIALDGRLNGVS